MSLAVRIHVIYTTRPDQMVSALPAQITFRYVRVTRLKEIINVSKKPKITSGWTLSTKCLIRTTATISHNSCAASSWAAYEWRTRRWRCRKSSRRSRKASATVLTWSSTTTTPPATKSKIHDAHGRWRHLPPLSRIVRVVRLDVAGHRRDLQIVHRQPDDAPVEETNWNQRQRRNRTHRRLDVGKRRHQQTGPRTDHALLFRTDRRRPHRGNWSFGEWPTQGRLVRTFSSPNWSRSARASSNCSSTWTNARWTWTFPWTSRKDIASSLVKPHDSNSNNEIYHSLSSYDRFVLRRSVSVFARVSSSRTSLSYSPMTSPTFSDSAAKNARLRCSILQSVLLPVPHLLRLHPIDVIHPHHRRCQRKVQRWTI